MNPTYEPSEIEARWYPIWEQSGVFRPEHRPDGEPFCMVIPPPNVTGSLHLGHALNHSIHDAIARRRRMRGDSVLWLPGTDHAGIATQNVVERDLAEEGLTRFDLGRERFVEQIWEWRRRYGNRINDQIRRLGGSVDWSRERFTMDDGLSTAVREVFVRLYEDDLIYRGNRIINWCPRCETALADIEVEHEQEQGTLTHIRYPAADGGEGVVVATTRPETMLGDTGVAVHPSDGRYVDLIGSEVVLPLVDRRIPVVADDVVDQSFGSGAVKVTPAHDATDFEIGARHGLDTVVVLDALARVTPEGGSRFEGMDRFEAREAVVAALEEAGLLVSVEEHEHSVGHCYRCGTVVEPRLSDQWFVRAEPLAVPAIEAVRSGDNEFIPEHWEKTYFHWMENIRDWTISRQIWWGHRIPAWYCPDGHVTVARQGPTECATCGAGELQQDPDVLDTWFSSALWPFSTLGWPDETDDLNRFYPNAILITGFDIIFFWVARMMKMGMHFMDEVPFRQTIIHGLVRDARGEKMSKSRGNTIDPVDIADEYGADPLRLALLQAANPGQDVPFDPDWVAGARRFGNKLWNAVRFVLRSVEAGSIPPVGGYPEEPTPPGSWILGRLGEVTERFDDLCDQYRFSDAFSMLYAFAWSEVFDWYLEIAKTELADEHRRDVTNATLGVVVRDLLKLFHPAIPFLTEELWGELIGDGLLAAADWPEPPAYAGPDAMADVQEMIAGVRRFRAEQGISPRVTLPLLLVDGEERLPDWAVEMARDLASVDVESVAANPGAGHTRIVAGSLEAFIPLAGLVDVEAERSRLEKALEAARQDRAQAERKLGNPAFVERAPAEVVAKEERKRSEADRLVAKLQDQLDALAGS